MSDALAAATRLTTPTKEHPVTTDQIDHRAEAERSHRNVLASFSESTSVESFDLHADTAAYHQCEASLDLLAALRDGQEAQTGLLIEWMRNIRDLLEQQRLPKPDPAPRDCDTDHRADPVQAVAKALIAHTRLSVDGRCSCGHVVPLGHSVAEHQAEAAVAAALPAIEREAKAEAWDEGFSQGWSDAQEAHDVPQEMDQGDWSLCTPNPYRIEQEDQS